MSQLVNRKYPTSEYFPIDGVFVLAPLIGGMSIFPYSPHYLSYYSPTYSPVAPESLPHPITIRVARLLRSFAGRLPLSPAVRGNSHSDPRVEEESEGTRTFHNIPTLSPN